MRKKEYDENDEIEIGLSHYVKDYYLLDWRFKEPRKWLFFKIRDKWKNLRLFSSYGFMGKNEDPNESFYWEYVTFDLGNRGDVQEYEKIKGSVRTKKELYDYFKVGYSMENYLRHLEDYTKWRAETDKEIMRLINGED